jgi:hypothetical protein
VATSTSSQQRHADHRRERSDALRHRSEIMSPMAIGCRSPAARWIWRPAAMTERPDLSPDGRDGSDVSARSRSPRTTPAPRCRRFASRCERAIRAVPTPTGCEARARQLSRSASSDFVTWHDEHHRRTFVASSWRRRRRWCSGLPRGADLRRAERPQGPFPWCRLGVAIVASYSRRSWPPPGGVKQQLTQSARSSSACSSVALVALPGL